MESFLTNFAYIMFYGLLLLILRVSDFRYNTSIGILESKLNNMNLSMQNSSPYEKHKEELSDIIKIEKEAEFKTKSLLMYEVNKSSNKGYNFIYMKSTKEYDTMGWHYHTYSKELFYCLSGKCVLYLIDTSSKKSHNIIIELTEGKSYFIKNKVIHSVSLAKDSEIIVIIKPPLMTKLGALYEKLFRKNKA